MKAQRLLSLQCVSCAIMVKTDGSLHMRLIVGFLVLNCPRVDIIAMRSGLVAKFDEKMG